MKNPSTTIAIWSLGWNTPPSSAPVDPVSSVPSTAKKATTIGAITNATRRTLRGRMVTGLTPTSLPPVRSGLPAGQPSRRGQRGGPALQRRRSAAVDVAKACASTSDRRWATSWRYAASTVTSTRSFAASRSTGTYPRPWLFSQVTERTVSHGTGVVRVSSRMIRPDGVTRTPSESVRANAAAASSVTAPERSTVGTEVCRPTPTRPSSTNPASTTASAMVHGQARRTTRGTVTAGTRGCR